MAHVNTQSLSEFAEKWNTTVEKINEGLRLATETWTRWGRHVRRIAQENEQFGVTIGYGPACKRRTMRMRQHRGRHA